MFVVDVRCPPNNTLPNFSKCASSVQHGFGIDNNIGTFTSKWVTRFLCILQSFIRSPLHRIQ
jgi:hypothetical protein